LQFAFQKATTEGKITIGVLCAVSFVSWTVIFSKTRQLWRARTKTRQFFDAYRAARDPLELFRGQKNYDGAPANEVYQIGAEELSYHLKNNPVTIHNKLKSAMPPLIQCASPWNARWGAEGLGLEKG